MPTATHPLSGGTPISHSRFSKVSARCVSCARPQANIRTLDLQVEDAKDNVTLGIMAYYLQVLYSREMLAVRREELRLSQTQLQRQNDLLESGKVPEVDVLQAKAQVASGEVAVVNAENDYRLALVDLTRALELDDTRGFDILPVDFDSTISLPASADDVYRNALNTNNGILAARSGITQADHAVSIAKSGYLPTLSFNAGLGSNYYTLSGVENPSFARQMKDNFSKSIGFRSIYLFLTPSRPATAYVRLAPSVFRPSSKCNAARAICSRPYVRPTARPKEPLPDTRPERPQSPRPKPHSTL